MDTPKSLIICNGFKDSDYIETALLSQKIGRNILIVIDRMSELELIIEASKRLNATPRIGVRAKLDTQGAGRWVESSGARSKFGLSPSEIVHCVNRLSEEKMLPCLELFHFHIGSQIPSIQDIKAAIREGTRFYTELHAMGATPKFIDVGGGLGVDYDGTGKGESSTNYTEQEYCNDVVSIVQSLCDEKNIPHPHIISESGRALVAHSSLLIFDVLGVNEVERRCLRHAYSDKDSRLVQDLHFIYENVSEKNINEFYNDLVEKKRDTLQLFCYGVLSLEQRAKAEDLYWAALTKMALIAKTAEDAEDISANLEKELSDTYFCNFSIFQSLPDSWAVEQRFPVMPIHRLNTKPDRRATLVDLTCDSDGKMDRFIDIDGGEAQDYLEVHSFESGKPYYLGVFLAGAYQEILGDLHNLFGDTDAVHITISETGYKVDHVVKGESITDVLSHVQYLRPQLLERIRQATESSILDGSLSRADARLIMEHYERGLTGYTYLNEQRTHL